MRDNAKAKILRATERLLAKRGFAGVSLRDIARAAKVSQPLIHHHFENKQLLFKAVQARIVEKFQHVAPPNDTPPEDLVSSLFTRLYELFRKDPTLVRILAWCHLEDDLAPWPGEESFIRDVVKHLSKAQTQGLAPASVHGASLLVLAQALAMTWWQFRDFYARFYDGQTRSTPKHDAKFFKDALALLRTQ